MKHALVLDDIKSLIDAVVVRPYSKPIFDEDGASYLDAITDILDNVQAKIENSELIAVLTDGSAGDVVVWRKGM